MPIKNPCKTPVEDILVDEDTGEILYFTPHCRPTHADNPALYTNVQPVYKWNKERTELVKVGERDVDKEIQACAVGITPYDLMERVQSMDAPELHRKTGFYEDITSLPETTGDAVKAAALLDKLTALNEKEQNNVLGRENAAGLPAGGAVDSAVHSGADQGAGEKAVGQEKGQVEKGGEVK